MTVDSYLEIERIKIIKKNLSETGIIQHMPEKSYIDKMLDEREEMTLEEDFSVCIFDDFSPPGEMLTMVAICKTKEEAEEKKRDLEKNGSVVYIYPPKQK